MSLRIIAVRLVKFIFFKTPLYKHFLPVMKFDMSVAQLNFIIQSLQEIKGDGEVLEIGVGGGATSVMINQIIKHAELKRKYIAIDTFSGFTDEDISYENNNRGKGYYEDVFFTLSLREKGFKLIIDEDLRMTHPYTSSIKPRAYIDTIYRQKKLVEVTGGSYLLFYLDIFASFCFYTILHIKSKFLN